MLPSDEDADEGDGVRFKWWVGDGDADPLPPPDIVRCERMERPAFVAGEGDFKRTLSTEDKAASDDVR